MIRYNIILYASILSPIRATPVLGLHGLLSEEIFLFTLGTETSLQRPRLTLGPLILNVGVSVDHIFKAQETYED